jgi:hypothetical protein
MGYSTATANSLTKSQEKGKKVAAAPTVSRRCDFFADEP